MRKRQRSESANRIPAVILTALLLLASPVHGLDMSNAVSLTLRDGPLHYSLPEGETTLIVCVPNASFLERFWLINENTSVHGELKIAVAGSRLPANDPKWVLVSGNIAFAHKRVFNLSLVGVEAKYVKLSFRVQKEPQLTTAGL